MVICTFIVKGVFRLFKCEIIDESNYPESDNRYYTEFSSFSLFYFMVQVGFMG